jgi:hypothetical protein
MRTWSMRLTVTPPAAYTSFSRSVNGRDSATAHNSLQEDDMGTTLPANLRANLKLH